MIEIKVDGRIVSVQETEPLFVGAVDIQHCHFTFDKKWAGFSRTAIFRAGSEAHTVLIDENDGCILPWELLTRKNIGKRLEVGVYGVSADTRIVTSVWDTLGLIREGSRPGTDARNPSDGIYEQIMARLQRIYEAVGIYDEGIRAMTQRAETAAQLAQESAASAAAAFEAIREFLYSGGNGGAPLIPGAPNSPHCIEYGTVVYNGSGEQKLRFNFSQSYGDRPVFITSADSDAVTYRVEPLRSDIGYYGGEVTVTNLSGDVVTATVSISACCAHPAGDGGA